MRAHASLRLGNVRGTTPKLLGSHRGSVCSLSVAPHVMFGALVWLGKRDSVTRHPLLSLNAGTAEPFRVSPPEAVAYQLELVRAGWTWPDNITFLPENRSFGQQTRGGASQSTKLSLIAYHNLCRVNLHSFLNMIQRASHTWRRSQP